MTTDSHSDIRRRPDGSIDTEFHMAPGRAARSAQAFALIGSLVGLVERLGTKLELGLRRTDWRQAG